MSLFNFGASNESTDTTQTTSGTSKTTAQQTEAQNRQQQITGSQTGATTQQQQTTGSQTTGSQTSTLDADTINALKGVLAGQVQNIGVPPSLQQLSGSEIDLSKLMTNNAMGVQDKVQALNANLAEAARTQFETSTLGDINTIGRGIGSKDNSEYLGTLSNARAALEGNIMGIQSQNTLQGISLGTQAGAAASGVAGQATSLIEGIQSGNPQSIQTVLQLANVLKGASTTQTIDTNTLQALTGATTSEATTLQNMIDALTGTKNLSSQTASNTTSAGTSETTGFKFGIGI